MPGFGRVPLNDVWSMLDACAPGHQRRERTHNWWILYGDRDYPQFPKGEHGARKNPEIEIGHIKKMARHLGILECAKQVIEGLK